jgi:hypothetical protein
LWLSSSFETATRMKNDRPIVLRIPGLINLFLKMAPEYICRNNEDGSNDWVEEAREGWRGIILVVVGEPHPGLASGVDLVLGWRLELRGEGRPAAAAYFE